MRPWKGRGRPCRLPVDEEAVSVPHALSPQGDPLFLPKVLVPPIPQVEFFPSMTLEAFQAYTNYWYAQA